MKIVTRSLFMFLLPAILIACTRFPNSAVTPTPAETTPVASINALEPTEPAASPTIDVPTKAQNDAIPAPLQVTKIGAMSIERAAHQATLLQTGQVLITGGCAQRGCERFHASTELFDPDTQTFRPATPMFTPRAGHAAVALPDGRVLVAGGWTGEEATASAEIYDPVTGEWTAVADMNTTRESLMAVPLPDGRVLISGGLDPAPAELFDPATATFSAIKQTETNHYLATAMADGRVLVTGGQNAAGETLRSAATFDPIANTFQPTGEMAVPRVKHAAALLTDGRVLIIGGSDNRGYSNRFTSTEIFDPASGRFAPGPDLQWGRHKIRDAVVVMPGGDVLIAGGAVRLERFDPVEQVFVPVTGELSGPQMFATATLLASGEVLVLGGYDDRTQPSDAAWLVHTGR